jgi:hypothetical protein
MRLLSFMKDDVVKVGLATGKGILDLAKCYQNTYGDTEAPNWLYSLKHLLAGGEDALNLVKKLERKAAELSDQSLFYRESEVKIQPPITNPRKFYVLPQTTFPTPKNSISKFPRSPTFSASSRTRS